MSEEAETAEVRAGDALDWPALEAWLRSHLEDVPAAPMRVLQFPRGAANLTYRLQFGDLHLVLRRPPLGKTAPGAHDMGREHRILSRLWRAYPRAPRAYGFCDDASVIGASFVVQEYRQGGVVIFDGAPAQMRDLPDLGERLTRALAGALADLHSVDFAAVGLDDLGRADGFIQRQLTSWRERWRRVASPEHDASYERIADRLERETPAAPKAAVIHNDFKLDNCQFRPGDPDEVVSVFDWDMATLGDPLVDVGITLAYWSHMAREASLRLPPKAAFARAYAELSGIDADQIRWYEAFACWRTGVVVQQLFDRRQRGDSNDARLAEIGRTLPVYIERAEAILDGRG